MKTAVSNYAGNGRFLLAIVSDS